MLQPYINEITEAIFTLIVGMIVVFLRRLPAAYEKWIAARTTESQRKTLKTLAGEAFAHAETVFKGKIGADKLNAATDYISQKLFKLGIVFTAEEMQAAIHKAWLDYSVVQKQKGVILDEGTQQNAS